MTRVRVSQSKFQFSHAVGIAAAISLVLSTPVAMSTGGGSGGSGSSSSNGYGDSAQIEINGYISPTCTFTTKPNVTSIGQMATDGVTPLGSLGFTCNMATSSAVSLTVKSLNGGSLKRAGGSDTVAYQVAWTFPSGSDVFQTIPASPLAFTLPSGLTGVQQLGTYKVKVTGPTIGKPAGDYKDIVTYTISP